MLSSLLKRSAYTAARAAAVRVPVARMAWAPRFYSSSSAQIRDQLKSVLAEEIELSNDEAVEIDTSFVEQFTASTAFAVAETPGTCDVQLVKKLPSGETVRVFFNVDAVTDLPLDNLEPEDYEQAMGEGLEQQLDSLDALLCNVNVMIEKPDNTGLFVTLLLKSGEERFEIERIEYKQDAAKFVADSIATNEFADVDYPGPRFVTLDEALQETLEDYFESIGIDADLAGFIVNYSEAKEEKEYNRWIGQLGQFFK